MKVLNPMKSWELFLKKGLTGNNGEFPKELEEIGRDIVGKCDGLPLAISVMGGSLAETWSNREWKEALNELNSHLGRAKNSVSAILELSYMNLSPQLKSCFLCLAFFKEDAIIPVKRLLNIMVGQCLIQRIGRTTTEEIARGYLDELINRNMAQVKDLTLDNQVKSCYLHDALRNICLKKAKKEIGLEILKGDSEISLHKPRHLVVQCDDLGSLSVNQNKHVRPLFLLNVEGGVREIKSSYWESFQRLTILDLDGYYYLERLPHSFRLLVGLKQLRIRRQSYKVPREIFFADKLFLRILKLPTWLNTLKKLELLDMRTEFVKFPNVALEMDNLRHVHANFVLGPVSAYSWKNVETLKYIRHKDWMRSNLRLMDNCQVRELGILLDDESSRVRASLEKLESLSKLSLVWDYILSIGATIIPHLENLTKLKLRGKMRKCPSASMLPPNLSHLTLEMSFLYEDPLQELSKVPKLSYLKLKEHSYTGERMFMCGQMPIS